MGLFSKKKNVISNEAVAPLCNQMRFDEKEAYKLLRTNAIFTLPDNKCRKIGITSALRGEGKSTVAINFSYTVSATKKKVLLIDMDMRLPSVAKKLGFKPQIGLTDYLAGLATANQIIYKNDKYDNWDIIFSGSTVPNPSELIGSNKMKELISGLENMYDYIVFDLPPVNAVSDALTAKEIIDGYILVVRENYSDRRSLSECVRQLSFLDANVLGFVLVDSMGNVSRYGKKYGKYYGSKYYKSYGYYKKDNED